jgi:2-polyprenyl-3-methyl-5-hydroxy-6-metoxy-1,4-benzoquinol methylase
VSAAEGESAASRDEVSVEALRRHRRQRGGQLPRIGLFLFDAPEAATLRKTVERIPEPLPDWLEEIVLMQDRRSGNEFPAPPDLLADRACRLQIHRNPRDYGHGGARKAAFEYALRRGFEYAVFMRGDGAHPPEALPQLLREAVVDGHVFVSAPPVSRGRGLFRRGVPAWRAVLGLLATAFRNATLGLRLLDYHASYRVYTLSAVQCLPFQLDANDRLFEAHIAMQHRALGAPLREVPVPGSAAAPRGEGAPPDLRACWAAVDYRLHQLHITQQGRYLVDRGVRYTFKRGETGSHMQIVEAIRPGSRVLDLGCSQGLLARPLRERDVHVTGVDARPPERLAIELDAYFQRDLESPLQLPTGRAFDYVVVADVIEHVRNRAQLLRNARRYLKPEGRLLISTPNVALWFYRLSLLAGRFEYGPRGVLDESHVHLFTRASFRREVEKAGFHVLRQRVTALPFEVVFQSTGLSRWIRDVSRLYHAVARLWPSMFAYQFILEAEITTLDEEATASAPRPGR